MGETLLAVIVGGLVASIAPIAHLVADHRRWTKETKLAHLREERKRLETMYSDTLSRLKEAMENNRYPSDMMSDIYILMPKQVADEVDKWVADQEKSPAKGQNAYLSISIAMKQSLYDLDKKIRTLIEN